MIRKLTFKVLESGKIPDGARQNFATIFPLFSDRIVNVTVQEQRDTASGKQRRYYRGIVVPAFMEYFAQQNKIFDNDMMHDQMMRVIGGFSNSYVNAFTGDPDCGRISYNDLTKGQAEGYHTLCLKWAAEHGFQIPHPNESEFPY